MVDRKPLVLVAEDDDALRKMLGHVLAEVAEVHLTADGMEALSWLRDSGRMPDLLISDVMMPRLDGLALAQRLKMDASLSRIPVIFLTAKSTPKDVIAGIQAGARHYLPKPFQRLELLDKVKKVLKLK
ncbi:MAG: response regulator [Sandaracinus sp.]|nr:response regulator [Sandaracinus sp.]MCB9631598.1 response regulator [Sandaracinus sp.]